MVGPVGPKLEIIGGNAKCNAVRLGKGNSLRVFREPSETNDLSSCGKEFSSGTIIHQSRNGFIPHTIKQPNNLKRKYPDFLRTIILKGLFLIIKYLLMQLVSVVIYPSAVRLLTCVTERLSDRLSFYAPPRTHRAVFFEISQQLVNLWKG